jgi:hypothetical protein
MIRQAFISRFIMQILERSSGGPGVFRPGYPGRQLCPSRPPGDLPAAFAVEKEAAGRIRSGERDW